MNVKLLFEALHSLSQQNLLAESLLKSSFALVAHFADREEIPFDDIAAAIFKLFPLKNEVYMLAFLVKVLGSFLWNV